jgi:hypothetical protein
MRPSSALNERRGQRGGLDHAARRIRAEVEGLEFRLELARRAKEEPERALAEFHRGVPDAKKHITNRPTCGCMCSRASRAGRPDARSRGLPVAHAEAERGGRARERQPTTDTVVGRHLYSIAVNAITVPPEDLSEPLPPCLQPS